MFAKDIYISTGSMQAGGTERVISILSNQLVSKGFRIKIFIWRSVPVFYKIDSSIEIIDIPQRCGSASLIKGMLYFRRYLKSFPPHFLLGFSAPFNIISLISSLRLNIKTVVCERNDPRFVPFHRYQRVIRNWDYHWADGILTQTQHNKDYFSTQLRSKIQVIYNPIFMDEKYIGSAKSGNHNYRVISVARLKKQKNQQLLINAFSRFCKLYPKYSLYIYGEGDQREQLEKLVKEKGLEGKVFFPGVSDRIFEILSTCETFVLPSNFEGMPNTLIEAMCIGLPCISTKVSGATDLIKDGENGLLIDIDNEEQLFYAMVKLAENPEIRLRMGINATKLYNYLNVNTILEEWYKYIIGYIEC